MILHSPERGTRNLLSESFFLTVEKLKDKLKMASTFVFGRSNEEEFGISGLPNWVSRKAFEVCLQKTEGPDQLTFRNIGQALILVRLHMKQADEGAVAGIKHYILVGDQVNIDIEAEVEKIKTDSYPYNIVKKIENILKIPLEGTLWTSWVEVIVLRTNQEIDNEKGLYQEKLRYVRRNEHVVFKFIMDSNEQWSLVEVSLNHYCK